MVLSEEVTPPTPTPSPESLQPVVMPTGNLELVGRIPLARGDSDLLNAFYVKVYLGLYTFSRFGPIDGAYYTYCHKGSLAPC